MMELVQLKEILSRLDEFKDVNSWKFDKINHGGVGVHSSIISKGKKRYFVKDIKDNEANALSLICPLKLKHFVNVVYPELLKEKVLVANVVSGKPISSKKLVPGLIKDFAVMQNKLNNQKLFVGKKYFSGNKLKDKDDGFFKRGYESNWSFSKKILPRIKKKYKLKITDSYIKLLGHLDKNRDKIIEECSRMPFSWQHHDFREANIIGKEQILVDFGSSYGHGPFLFDLAPFFLNNDSSLRIFVKYSNTCKNYSFSQIKRWVFVAGVVNMVERLYDHLKNPEGKSEVDKFLAHEWKTHKNLFN